MAGSTQVPEVTAANSAEQMAVRPPVVGVTLRVLIVERTAGLGQQVRLLVGSEAMWQTQPATSVTVRATSSPISATVFPTSVATVVTIRPTKNLAKGSAPPAQLAG